MSRPPLPFRISVASFSSWIPRVRRWWTLGPLGPLPICCVLDAWGAPSSVVADGAGCAVQLIFQLDLLVTGGITGCGTPGLVALGRVGSPWRAVGLLS